MVRAEEGHMRARCPLGAQRWRRSSAGHMITRGEVEGTW